MTTTLTPVRADILHYIISQVEELGFPPSMSEIGTACGIKSKASVAYHLSWLEANGYITRVAGAARAIRVVKP